jgi:hypothetical protein
VKINGMEIYVQQNYIRNIKEAMKNSALVVTKYLTLENDN